MKLVVIFVSLVFVLGCAHNSGVFPIDGDQFMVSNQGHSFLASMPKLRKEASDQASSYCRSSGKSLLIVRYEDAKGPFVAGNFPRTDLIFKCR